MEVNNHPIIQPSNPQTSIFVSVAKEELRRKRRGEAVGEILKVERGKTLKGIDFHFADFKKGTWKNYTHLDGLAHNDVKDYSTPHFLDKFRSEIRWKT